MTAAAALAVRSHGGVLAALQPCEATPRLARNAHRAEQEVTND